MNKLSTLAVGAFLLVAVAGCSADNSAAPESSSSPMSETESDDVADLEIPAVDAECVDGVATIDAANSNVTIDGDCATVIVNISNSLITVGAVETLEINGAINLVTAESVDSVKFTANGNTVRTASTPTVDDQGEQNELQVP